MISDIQNLTFDEITIIVLKQRVSMGEHGYINLPV